MIGWRPLARMLALTLAMAGCTGRKTPDAVATRPVQTVDSRGYPVYGERPMPTYADEALSAERRTRLVSEIPQQLATLESELASASSRIDAAFAGARDSFQYERIVKRREMVGKLVGFIRHMCGKGTTSGLCQAETGVENLKAFLAYFKNELDAWRNYPEAPGVKAVRFDIRDFGARGDGVTDDEPAFRRALDKIRGLRGKPSVLDIPAGEYLLKAKLNPDVGKPTLWFANVENCILSGEDPERVKLVLDVYTANGIDFRGCVNSTLRNVQVYWRETPFVAGEVESVDRATGSLVLVHFPGTLKPDDPRLARVGHPNSCMQFERTGVPILAPLLWYDYRCDDLGGGRYRLYFDPNNGVTRSMPVRPGSVFVVPDRDNSIAALQAANSRFFTFDRVWVRNSRCGTFCPGMSYHPTVVRCRIFPREPRFCLSTNADGNFTSVGTAIMHCDFTNMNDDGSNAHGRGQLFFSFDAATGRCRHGSNWGWERPGDFVQVVSTLDGRYLMNTRVKSVAVDASDRSFQQTEFEDALPSSVKSYTSLGIKPYDYQTRRKIFLGSLKTDKYPDQFYVPFAQGVGYLCLDNHFANIRGVAVQVQTPCSLVESNRIENIYRGIELSGLLHYQEGPPPYNVTIRGNVIRNVNRGIRSSFMTLNHPPAVTAPMANLIIEDNVIENAAERDLALHNAENALVRGNVFSGKSKIELRVCADVRFERNRFGGRPIVESDFVTNCVSGVVVADRWR